MKRGVRATLRDPQALLALGRPEVALAVDRGQAGAGDGAGTGGTGRPSRTLAQATTLLEIRLRCVAVLRPGTTQLTPSCHHVPRSSSLMA